MYRILVVDDEERIRELIKKYAEFEGYEVTEASNGMEAVHICRNENFDLIIMDIMMPELDGFSACREIRKKSATPVVMLSARGEEYDRIHGFELGVDDYVVKPFSPKELMMRVGAILKRAKGGAGDQREVLSFGGLTVDFTGRIVYIDGKRVDMTPKEYELFFYMVKNRGIALTREKLINEVWGYDFVGDDRTLDTHIKLLRKSLGPYSGSIVTLRGWGTALKLDKISIRWQICCGFVAFAGVLLILLWLFQIVFLDSFYRSIKTQKVESCTQTIAANLDLKKSNRNDLIQEISNQNDLTVRVLNMQAMEDIFEPEKIPDIYLYNKLNFVDIYDYYMRAQEQGGSLLETNDADLMRESFPEGLMNKYGSIIPVERSRNTSILSIQLAKLRDGTEVMIMVYAVISPVNSTVETLRIQLMIITAILLVLAVALSILLSRLVSKPIMVTTESAKYLAKGKYDVEFDGGGYKEVVELNKTLSYAATELSKVEELRRDLIANISHDLRTPLTMITGYGEMMRDIPGENTPENVQIIIDEAKRLSSLVTDLLDLSKLQSGTQSLTLSEFNLTDSVRAIMTRYSMLTSQDGYHVNFYSDCDVTVKADEIKISQVIYNLINNAINYVGDDKTVTVTQRVTPGRVRLEVADHGKGIAQEDIPYIWDRYYKVDKTHKRAVIGTGLGLSIVKSVLDMHHAQYGVQSVLGQGSTFWFELEIFTEKDPRALPPM